MGKAEAKLVFLAVAKRGVFCDQTAAWAQTLARDSTCPASVLQLLPCTVFHGI
jgi:hypothetical protein